MGESNIFLPLTVKFFEKDMPTASLTLEGMNAEDAARALKNLPIEMAVRIVKNLQISFAATLLAKTNEAFLERMTSRLEPQLLASVLMHFPEDVWR